MSSKPSINGGMVCTSCQFKNPPGAKFCQQCGGRFQHICSTCGIELPAEARFCHQCGKPTDSTSKPEDEDRSYTPRHLADKILSTRSALEGERKQVTVLFADVKGSMELAEQVGPEDWHGILDDFFQILADGIHNFEGTINQYTGDGIMALFGAPLAHEDHAMRACHAALYLQNRLRRHADDLRVKRGLNFGVRIGLNSGEVVVGKIGDDLRMDYTAQGQTVGLAARMEQLAESGCVYLTEHTVDLIEGFFRLRDLGSSKIKGVTHPARIYELQGIGGRRTRLDISRERGFSRFVGRSEEMAVIQTAFQRAIDGKGNVVGIVGEPGIGKSRLCYEFLEHCRRKGIPICKAFCTSHGKTVPLLPVLQLLRSFFGITEYEQNEDARKKIAGTLILLDEDFKNTLPIWFEFLAVADPHQLQIADAPEERQHKLFALIQRLIHTKSNREPMVILVEDLHWIDPASDAMIGRIVDAVTDTQATLLLNFRPEYHQGWMKRSSYQNLPLSALNTNASRELINDLLGDHSSLEDFKRNLTSRTLGNPFFIEELVRSLVESGNIAGQRGAYRLVKPAKTQMLPRTVQAVLAARIDRLGDSAKQALQTAAVIGRELEESVLRKASDLSATQLSESLHTLNEAEFIYHKAFYPESVFAFRHPIAREVAYRSLLTETRGRLHRRVAQAIEKAQPDRQDELAGLLAHHWEQAKELLKAARWHRRAAQTAGFSEFPRAFFHWRQVLMLLQQVTPTNEIQKLQLEACCGALDIGGRVDISPQQVADLFEEGCLLSEKFGDHNSLLRLHEDMAARLGWSGDLEGQRRYLQKATKIAEQMPESEIKLGLLQRRYVAEFHQGDLKTALKLAGAGIARCENAGASLAPSIAKRLLRTFLLSKTNAIVLMGKLKEASYLMDQAARLMPSGEKNNEDSRTTHTNALVRAQLSYYVGDVEASLHDARSFVELAQRSGSTWAIPTSAFALGRAHILGQRWPEAVENLEYALAQARQHELGLEAEASQMAFLAEALSGWGEHKRALATAYEAVAVAGRRKTLFWELQAQVSLAGILLYPGTKIEHRRIEAALEKAIELIDKTGGEVMRPFVIVRQAEYAKLKGDATANRDLLQEAYRLFMLMEAHGHARSLAATISVEPTINSNTS
jgi:class 3 adenylate cyclase/ribosomal protein L40E